MTSCSNDIQSKSQLAGIWAKLCFGVLVSSAITGCLSSTPTQPQAEQVVVAPAANSPAQLVSEVAQRLEKGKADKIPTLSLVYFPEALEEFENLKEMNAEYNPKHSGFFSAGYSYENISEKRDTIMLKLDKAYLAYQNINNHLSDVIDNINYLKTLDLTNFQSRHKGLIEDAHDVFKDVERAEAFQGFESDKNDVMQDMRTFEQDVMLVRFHQGLEKRLLVLDEKVIPQSHQDAQEKLDQLQITVLADPRKITAMNVSEAIAGKAVTRAETILAEVLWVKDNKSNNLEVIVLKYRTPLDQSLPAVLDKDVSELPFEQQLPVYVEQIQTMQQRLQANVSSSEQGEIERLSADATALQVEALKGQLNAEFDERLAAALLEKEDSADQKMQQAMEEMSLADKGKQKEVEQATLAQEMLKQDLATAQADLDSLAFKNENLMQQIAELKADAEKGQPVAEIVSPSVKPEEVIEAEEVVDFDFEIVSPSQ